MRNVRCFLILWTLISPLAYALNQNESDELVKVIDERQGNSGDYKSLVYIEEKEKSKPTKNFEAMVYRRDQDDKWMILFVRPSSEAGKGYLRVDKNLFLYDPATGKWERTTERARIGGTNSQRSDFDQSKLSEEFSNTFIAEEKLGKFTAYHLKLIAKPKMDVAYPFIELWVDKETQNILKRQDFSLSAKLMRTIFYPQWTKVFSKSKGKDVFVPKEIRIFDEIEKENNTIVVLKDVNLDPLEENLFTKAWIEKKSK
ncbi:MAG: outer membrane lipoprotein-sorting protein [Oligoflexales bacterium]|nr:outer membrane lipoprotein-sorting protein [Oligoflexales bacterium]